MPSTVSWHYDAKTDPVAGAIVLAAIGSMAGLLVGPLLLAVGVVAAAALAGDPIPLLALAGVLAVAAAVHRAEVVALRSVDGRGPGRGYGRAGLALALLGGGAVHAATIALAESVRYNVGFVVLGVALLLATTALVGEGEVDPEAGVVRYHGEELPLDAVQSVHALPLGDRVVALVRYRGGVPTASRLPTFSATAYRAAEPLLRGAGDRASEGGSPTAGDDRDGLPRAVRVAAAAMGLGTLVLAGAAALLAPPDARPLIGALVLTTLPVAAVFGWYAYAG